MNTSTADRRAFFAFASQSDGLTELIEGAITKYMERSGEFDIVPWTELKVSGALIWMKVLSEIDHRAYFLADVSTLNPNVTYEMGYAIGQRRKLRFVLNENLNDENERNKIGIFDVLGYYAYRTEEDLLQFLFSSISDAEALYVDEDSDRDAPIFLFDAYEKSELVNYIKTCVKKWLVRFRSHDPQEQTRLPVHEAIRQVALSEGIVVSLVPETYAQSRVHNFRAAFVAGLSHGMGKELSIIQIGDAATPLDFREFTYQCYSKENVATAL